MRPPGKVSAKGDSMKQKKQKNDGQAEHTTSAQKMQIVAPILRHGREQATPADQLCSILGYSERILRLHVQQEREGGAIILADAAGYYLPSEDEQTAFDEITAYRRKWLSRTNRSYVFLRVLDARLQNVPEQIKFEG